MIKDMTVKSVRYLETNRGLGYEAKTNEGSIWNDGNGGPTYFEPQYPKYNNKDFIDFSESDLENMINIYEKVKKRLDIVLKTKYNSNIIKKER